MKKKITIFISALICLFFFSSIASAHVTVVPNTSKTSALETYTVKVPVEKNSATTKITLKVPAGLEIESYQPVPGWKFSSVKDASGKTKTITFAATGEGILPGQFQQFTFVAKNPDKPGKIAWDAFQFYKDGSIVEWTGNEGSDTPHAITNIVTAKGTQTNNQQETQTATAKDTKTAESGTNYTVLLVVSVIALLLSIAALIVSLRKK